MFTKLYDKLKNYIKENIKFVFLLVFLFFLFTFELPYYIDAPGGLLDVTTRLEVEYKQELKGSFNLAYVSEFRATFPSLIIAYFNKDWKVVKKEEVIQNNETIEEMEYRNHLMLDEANQNATIVGFTKANEYFQVTDRKINVIYIYDKAKTDLKIKDQITKVNGVSVQSKEDVLKIINNIPNNEKITFTVLNNNETYTRYGYKSNVDGHDLVGIILAETKEIDTNIDIGFKFKNSESGPSGGFMMALSIYNYLNGEDLTKGLKIVGTGTIDESGNVGSIGGIEYKIKAAVKEKADLFFVPKDNYDDALKTVQKNKLNLKIIKISNIDEAITYLKES